MLIIFGFSHAFKMPEKHKINENHHNFLEMLSVDFGSNYYLLRDSSLFVAQFGAEEKCLFGYFFCYPILCTAQTSYPVNGELS